MNYPVDRDKRLIWAMTRAYLENDNFKYKRYGGKRRSHWTLFERFVRYFGYVLKLGPLYRRGYENARKVVVNRLDLRFAEIPESFRGYRILHLTDLHLDCVKGIEDIICDRIQGLEYDLCVITGDYRESTHGGFKQILPPFKKIVDAIRAQDGILALLGNHDSYLMVEEFEAMGVRVLTNETVKIERRGEHIWVTGVDDPSKYYTDNAQRAMEEHHNGFKIVLVHSPELFDLADENDYQLYLCGHTHGGQIRLPGGFAPVTHLKTGRKFYRGLWHYNNMIGYTNQGCSASGIPVRFNTQSEVALITLWPEEETGR